MHQTKLILLLLSFLLLSSTLPSSFSFSSSNAHTTLLRGGGGKFKMDYAINVIGDGINFNPEHSLTFVNAQKVDDVNTMQAEIIKDLKAIKTAGFTTIKTYFAQYAGILTGTPTPTTISELARQQGLKVLLGVYEFPDHPEWTPAQIKSAIYQANTFPDTVVGICVGNEDLVNRATNAWDDKMVQRITNDIVSIKSGLVNPVPFLSSQIIVDWGAMIQKLRVNDGGAVNLLNSIDYIGLNDYPFWERYHINCTADNGAKTKYCNPGTCAAQVVITIANLLTNVTGKPVIITEEGWPSTGNGDYLDMTVNAEVTYFQYWKSKNHGTRKISSFFFAMYDKMTTEPGPDHHFGLCTSDRLLKHPNLTPFCNVI